MITSRANPRVKQLRAASAGQSRLAAGLVALEGEHLVQEVLRSGLKLNTVFVSGDTSIDLPPGTEVVTLAPDVFASAVETRSPQGIAALLAPPLHSMDDLLRGTPMILIAAGVQDPGNLGTLVRSAEAFGATGVLLTPGTVSPWGGKCLRASAGSLFRLPVIASTEETWSQMAVAGVEILAAVKEGGLSPDRCRLFGPTAFLIGNEGAGLAPQWLARATAKVTLNCPGPVESLNAAVAGSLLLYEASRQRAGQ